MKKYYQAEKKMCLPIKLKRNNNLNIFAGLKNGMPKLTGIINSVYLITYFLEVQTSGMVGKDFTFRM